jgi:hypothetical protein
VCYTCQAGINPSDLGFLGLTMRRSAAVAWRAFLILLLALGFVAAGVGVDRLAGTSPLGTLASVVVAVVCGTIMILVIVTSSFPKPPNEES